MSEEYVKCSSCENETTGNKPFIESNFNSNNDKFVWKENEIKIVKTQCELCKYNDKEKTNICSQFLDKKPDQVLSNEIKCPKFERIRKIDL